MTDPEALRPARPAAGILERIHDPDVNARLYRDVGARWSWTDRLGWNPAEWAGWTRRVRTDVLYVDGGIAGYYELDPARSGSVEIAIFGLREAYHGHGLGGHLLTQAIRRAWTEPGARRVWVHTCSLDGPHALPNYLARGLRIFRVDGSPAGG